MIAPDRRELLAGLATMAAKSTRAAAMGDGRAIVGAVGIKVTRAGPAGLQFVASAGQTLSPAFRWHIGSNTKAMTAALYARLVDQGRCRWGATVPSLFPGITVDPAWREATVERLMGHVAGVSDALLDDAWLAARHRDRRPVRIQRREFVEHLLAGPPRGQPGRFAYSNANFILIGAAIEQATDRDWEAVIAIDLFRPLGIASAGQGAPPRDGPWGHEITEFGSEAVDPAGADNPVVLGPAGRVHLTPGDYARFLAVFLDAGEPLLRRATLDRLLMPPIPGARYGGGWSLAGPPSTPSDLIGHDGSNTMWYTRADIRRSVGIGYAAFANVGGEPGRRAVAAMMAQLSPSSPTPA